MNLDENECAVWCGPCNCYLYATYDPLGRKSIVLTKCPYPKKTEYRDGRGLVEVCDTSGEGRYGRS